MRVAGPNVQQIEYWNEISGPKWVKLGDRVDAQIAPLGRRAMDRAGIGRGARVLDVGCGCGHATVELAARVGEAGEVVGVDVSGPMLADARRRAADAPNVRFEHADAQTHGFEEGAFDVAFSRFGVMFFSDPPDAFANLARALRPGGRMAFVCWQALARNPWMALPLAAVAEHVELPAPPSPDAPGPFAFADAERVRSILEKAGLAEIRCEAIETELTVGGGGDLDETVAFLLQMGPAGAALREAGPEALGRAAGAVRAAIEPFAGAGGVVLPAAAWIFTASRSG